MRPEDKPAVAMLLLTVLVLLVGALSNSTRADIYGVLAAAIAAYAIWLIARKQ